MEIDVLVIAQHVLNIAVLYILLRVLLYNPVRKFMKKREAEIAEKLSKTESDMKAAEELKARNEQMIVDADVRAQRAAEERTANAAQEAERILENAHVEVERMLREARAKIKAEKREAMDLLVDQTAALAVDLATRILGREISLEDNQRLIDEYFSKVG